MSKKPKFTGLTAANCCDDCNRERCVISEQPVCGHPFKGSLTGASGEIVARVQDARRYIQHQAVERKAS